MIVIIERKQWGVLDMQHKVLLLDELGEKWGKTHVYHNLRTPADAIKLLCINYPDFAEYLATSHEKGIVYKVTQVDIDLEESDLLLPLGQHDLVITPVISGSGRAGKFIMGAILIGVAIGTGGTSLSFGLGGFAGGVGISAAVGNIGIALAIRGVSEMLAPQQQTFEMGGFNVGQGGFLGGPSSVQRGADGQQSYAYRGAANTVGIGKTIPLVYGKAMVGSHLISTDIQVVDESDKLANTFVPPSPNTVRVNGNIIKQDGSRTSNYEGTRVTRVSFGKKIKAYHGRKFQIDKSTINLATTAKQKVCDNFDIDDSGEMNESHMNMMFDFHGIRDRVGGTGSTIIDGFITFAVIVEEPQTESTVLNQRITVQGLMKNTHRVRYIFRFQPVFRDEHPFNVFIQIIDKELINTSTVKMFVRRIGYRFFKGGRA